MIVDTSALMAILLGEDEAVEFNRILASATDVRISAGNFLELVITATRQGLPTTLQKVDELLAIYGIRIEPVTGDQAMIAREAHVSYGRGRHPASLNFGDCFAYALAKATNMPLLFKGNDFAQTDISQVLS